MIILWVEKDVVVKIFSKRKKKKRVKKDVQK